MSVSARLRTYLCSCMKMKFQSDRSRLSRLVSLLGIVLMVAFGLISAMHAHAQSSQSEDEPCAICAVAHAPAAIVVPVPVPVLVFAHVQLVLFTPQLRSFEGLFSLYSRPPPPTA